MFYILCRRIQLVCAVVKDDNHTVGQRILGTIVLDAGDVAAGSPDGNVPTIARIDIVVHAIQSRSRCSVINGFTTIRDAVDITAIGSSMAIPAANDVSGKIGILHVKCGQNRIHNVRVVGEVLRSAIYISKALRIRRNIFDAIFYTVDFAKVAVDFVRGGQAGAVVLLSLGSLRNRVIATLGNIP